MPKPRFYLKQPHSEAPTLIYLKYFAKPRLLTLSTGCKVHPRDWNEKTQRPRKSHPDAAELGTVLDRIETTVTSAVMRLKADGRPITVEALRRILEGENVTAKAGSDIIPYILENFKDRKSASVYTNLSANITAFTRRNKRGRTFEEIDSVWFRDFQKFLISQDHANTYAARLLTALKTVVKTAALDKVTRNTEILLSPIGITAEPAGGIVLTLEDVLHLANFPLEGDRLKDIRDCFVCACLTGLRHSDWGKLTLEPSSLIQAAGREFIQVATQKTSVIVHVPLFEPVKQILQRNGGRLRIISDQKANDYIKEMAKAAGFTDKVKWIDRRGGTAKHHELERWELMTTHTGRRTFISACRASGMPDNLIAEMTGHSKRKTMTDVYDRRNFEQKAAQMEPYLRQMESVFPSGSVPLKWLNEWDGLI